MGTSLIRARWRSASMIRVPVITVASQDSKSTPRWRMRLSCSKLPSTREPWTMSASSRRIGSTTEGSSAGSCWPSASSEATTTASRRRPSSYPTRMAWPPPRRIGSLATRAPASRAAASVPSSLASSTTSGTTGWPSTFSGIAASTEPTLTASLSAGSTTTTRSPAGSATTSSSGSECVPIHSISSWKSRRTTSVSVVFRRISSSSTTLPKRRTARSRRPPPWRKLNTLNSGSNNPGAIARSPRPMASAPEMIRFNRVIRRRRYRATAETSSRAAKIPPRIRRAITLRRGRERLSGPPPDPGEDPVEDHPVPVSLDRLEHRLHQRLREEVRLEPEVEELRVRGVVVVLLGLYPGIVDPLDHDLEAVLAPGPGHQLRELDDRELLGELVEHPVLAGSRRVRRGKLHAPDRVDDVQVPASLAALPVDGQGMTDHGLEAEPVQRGPEHLVVIESGEEALVAFRVLRVDPVHDALVQVGGPEVPDPARQRDVHRVVHLRRVVEGAWLLRERKDVGSTLVPNLDEALLDVDVRRPVLAHRPELHQVRVRGQVTHGEQDVQRADDVVVLGERGVGARGHRVRRRGHLAVVHDDLGLELAEDPLDDVVVAQVTHRHAHTTTVDLLPRPGSGRQALGDGGQRVGFVLPVGPAAQPVVDEVHVVTEPRQMHRGRPAQVPVATEDQDAHGGFLRSSEAIF